jgi:hypothetical protein
MEITEIQKVIEKILESFKKNRRSNNMDGLLKDGIASLEYSYYLISIITDSESGYRKKEADLISQDPKISQAKAETLAKATEEYKNWQKARYLYELLLELNMTAKKLSNNH